MGYVQYLGSEPLREPLEARPNQILALDDSMCEAFIDEAPWLWAPANGWRPPKRIAPKRIPLIESVAPRVERTLRYQGSNPYRTAVLAGGEQVAVRAWPGTTVELPEATCCSLLAREPQNWVAVGWVPDEALLRRMRPPAPPQPPQRETPMKALPFRQPWRVKADPNAGAVQFSWVQYTGTGTFVADIAASGIEQHVTAVTNQVLFLPFVICKQLLSVFGTVWQGATVAPSTLATAHDAGTGLDITYAPTDNPWGVDTVGWYFDPSGVGSGTPATASLNGGVVTLTTNY